MLYGVKSFITEDTLPPAELARIVEQRGFESLWAPDTYVASSGRLPLPDRQMPRVFWHRHTYDPFLALTAAATATTTLKLGTDDCLMFERDPIVLAKTVATLDRLSTGRFMFGIGDGSSFEEIEIEDANFEPRWLQLRERVLALKALWTQKEAEFHGEYVSFDHVLSSPKSLQNPYPPIFMRGDGPNTFDQLVEFCDGWMASGGPRAVPTIARNIVELRRRFEAAGRDPDALQVTIFWSFARPEPDVVDQLQAAGIHRLVFSIGAKREIVERSLDRLAALIT